ncbi:MAG: aminoglycoside phosphotransferase family protein [Microthrixaceae bacterium]
MEPEPTADATTAMRATPRLAWSQVPAPVRLSIEQALGSTVRSADSQEHGFSPGLAARCVLDDGRRVFVKAVSEDVNVDSARLARHEIRVNAHLGDVDAAPQLLHADDEDAWVVAVFEDVDGRQPLLPWTLDDLELVLRSVDHAPGASAGAPAELPTLVELLGDDFSGWRKLCAAGAPSPEDTPMGADALAELEATWVDHVAADHLIHADLRADNLLIDTADHVRIVDWANAALGPAWFDVACMVPSIAANSSWSAAEIWSRSAFAESVELDALTAAVAVLAGYFTEASQRPPVPQISGLREFQAAQARPARAWLTELLRAG